MNIRSALLMVALLATGFWACTEDQGPTQGEGQISGTVTDESSGNPLAQVNIQAQTAGAGSQNATTDAEGKFDFKFPVDSTITVTVSMTKSGYRDTTITVPLQAGVLSPLNVQLRPRSVIVGGTGGGTGLAQTIAFLGSSPTEISVYGVGGQETSTLGFEVRDSLGLPIDAAHAVTLTFSALGGPNGGEYISPLQVATNTNGRAYTTFNSGIRSGVVQVLATTTVGSRTISTSPIRLVIHAGFPDQNHFTVGPRWHNFPTLGIFGKRDPISVLVGDIYSNPVVRNTAVYFSTTGGVIQASVFTTTDGQGSADLISGNPVPFGQWAAADSGDAYHYVVAHTIGQNGTAVKDSTLILWSGHSMVYNVLPGTFSISNGSFQEFSFTVADYLGHPLAAGTTITVIATVPPPPDPNSPVNQVQLAFGANGTVVLDDFLGRGDGSTQFSFRLSDGSTLNQATAVSVSISVTGPNGDAYATINGTVF
jgi:hypothetical protein